MPALQPEYDYYEYARRRQGTVNRAVPCSSARKSNTNVTKNCTPVSNKNLKTSTTRDITKKATRVATTAIAKRAYVQLRNNSVLTGVDNNSPPLPSTSVCPPKIKKPAITKEIPNRIHKVNLGNFSINLFMVDYYFFEYLTTISSKEIEESSMSVTIESIRARR